MNTAISDMFEKRVFLTNAGTETYLVFQQQFDLPEFCGFLVHEDEEAWRKLEQHYLFPTFQTAASSHYGLLLDALVWRAQPDFIAALGRSPDQLAIINKRAVQMTRDSIDRWRDANQHTEQSFPVLVTADIGPRGDGYQVAGVRASVDSAFNYHREQIELLADAGVDLVCALTMTTADESIGIANVASAVGLPIIVSPTVEIDGTLPDGTPLGQYIEHVDAATSASPIFYMVNCAHPSHLLPTLRQAQKNNEAWVSRFRGFRANASTKSHAELDNSTELDRGDMHKLGTEMKEMQEKFNLRVIGGCCGTDHEHLAAMA